MMHFIFTDINAIFGNIPLFNVVKVHLHLEEVALSNKYFEGTVEVG